MSSIGPNIPNAGNELHIEGSANRKDEKTLVKQTSTSQVALKALGQMSQVLPKINIIKHLSSLKDLSSGLSKFSEALFAKIFTKQKSLSSPLMTFDDVAGGSVKKSQLQQTMAKLAKSRKPAAPINLMDNDTLTELKSLRQDADMIDLKLHEDAQQANQELNKALNKAMAQHVHKSTLSVLEQAAAKLSQKPEAKRSLMDSDMPELAESDEMAQSRDSSPFDDLIDLREHEDAQKANQDLNKALSQGIQKRKDAASANLKEAASKLKLGGTGDYHADFEALRNSRRQVQSDEGQAGQVKKKVTFADDNQQTRETADAEKPSNRENAELKQAASKLKLGGSGDYRADFNALFRKTKQQIDVTQGEVEQVKKKADMAKDLLNTAGNSGLVDKASAKELAKNLNFFTQMSEKNIRALEEMNSSLDNWTIKAQH